MSERREGGEEEEEEEEETGGGEEKEKMVTERGASEEKPPEGDTEPGRGGEEEERHDRETPGVLQSVGEAQTQADLHADEEEKMMEPQSRDDVGNSTATVKVVLVPEGHVMTTAFPIGLSIQELKLHVASELRVPAQVLQVRLDGRVVEEQQSLMELGVRPQGSTRMEVSSIDPGTHPLRLLRPPDQDNMPDVITVRVQKDEGVYQEVVVEIERPPQQKAFLGGYRHRLTGVEFHHAAVQPPPKRRPDRGVEVTSRWTQTGQRSQVQQCHVDASTQMTSIGCYVSCSNDRLVAPGNYTTADQYHDRRLRAAVLLQSHVRRWLSLQEVQRLRRVRDRRLALQEAQERRIEEEKEERTRDRHQRLTNPQKKEDLMLLYQALENWRCEEEQQINSSLRGAHRKAALCSLLEQETQVIADIERHRVTVLNHSHEQTVRKFLDKSAAPHRWRASDGRLLEMESECTIRASDLKDLYNHVNQTPVDKETRLQVLMALKHTVMEQRCQVSGDLVDLIHRELDLMGRGVRALNLEGLRRRISDLFLQYIKTPAVNPRVATLLKVPQNPSDLKKVMVWCRSCQRYLLSANFSPSASGSTSGRCRDCTGLEDVGTTRNNLMVHRNILMRLRAHEQNLDQDSKIPFLLQVEDVRYLVEVLWSSSSALSSTSDLSSLVLVRWDRRRHWSPWNCILLAKEETRAHLEVEDLHQSYESSFVRRVEHKHTLARRHFGQIPVMAEYLDSQLPPAAAALSNLLVSRPVAVATGKQHTSSTAPSSAH